MTFFLNYDRGKGKLMFVPDTKLEVWEFNLNHTSSVSKSLKKEKDCLRNKKISNLRWTFGIINDKIISKYDTVGTHESTFKAAVDVPCPRCDVGA